MGVEGVTQGGADGRMEPTLPAPSAERRWLTTVMFTDVVDSTRRAMALGDSRWLDLAFAHEAMVCDQVRRFRGRVLQRLGDGVLALFRSPAAGVRCGRVLVESARGLGIDIRVGLHVGECVRRGGQVRGLVFHVGARVAAAAAPGEVLVSHTVRDIVMGTDLAFVERGRHVLKGLPGEWPLYAATES
ncbi:MAG TPA: adenylate/guanylate cyclase domain-containing protein [Candidatus Binatia bacterium]|nr:adenylate/guanylate cyclase domain-containing protein [Candidatus Binatia bacterium]